MTFLCNWVLRSTQRFGSVSLGNGGCIVALIPFSSERMERVMWSYTASMPPSSNVIAIALSYGIGRNNSTAFGPSRVFVVWQQCN